MDLMIHQIEEIYSKTTYKLEKLNIYVKKIIIRSKKGFKLELTLFSENKENLEVLVLDDL